MRIPLRILALICGIAGALVGFLINLLNSTLHFVGQITGITDNSGHFFIGTMVSIVAVVGAIVVMFAPEAGAVILVLCAIGYFFAIGWWAIIPAIFLLLGAFLATRTRAQRRPAMS